MITTIPVSVLGRGKQLILLLSLLILVSCVAKPVPLGNQALQIRTGKFDPGEEYVEVGPITATHGGGCGIYGSTGSYEGAYALLKNKATTLGADYVQIYKIVEPHSEIGCFHKAYTITGTA